jgi:hypothetical protein
MKTALRQFQIQRYDRHSTTSDIEGVLKQIKSSLVVPKVKYIVVKTKTLINGVSINTYSLRLQTFLEKGTECAECKLKATHFAIERAPNKENESYHLNLWGLNDKSEEILFTHDHIIARALGGKDHISNTQTMCCFCNWEKGRLEEAAVRAKALKTL